MLGFNNFRVCFSIRFSQQQKFERRTGLVNRDWIIVHFAEINRR